MSKSFIPFVAMLLIAVIEIFAIKSGLDGTVLAASIAVIAGIAGYHVKSKSKSVY
jgi:hypothetical protein